MFHGIFDLNGFNAQYQTALGSELRDMREYRSTYPVRGWDGNAFGFRYPLKRTKWIRPIPKHAGADLCMQ